MNLKQLTKLQKHKNNNIISEWNAHLVEVP